MLHSECPSKIRFDGGIDEEKSKQEEKSDVVNEFLCFFWRLIKIIFNP